MMTRIDVLFYIEMHVRFAKKTYSCHHHIYRDVVMKRIDITVTPVFFEKHWCHMSVREGVPQPFIFPSCLVPPQMLWVPPLLC